MRQLVLHPNLKLNSQFGGALQKGRRKTARPISTRQTMHTTLRSERATGRFSFLLPKNANQIRDTIKVAAKKFGIKVYEISINGNHLHLLTLSKTRHGYKAFLKMISGTIAMKLTGSRKGRALIGQFWSQRPWSRIVVWGRAFFSAKRYVIQNRLESAGIIPYQERKNKPRIGRPQLLAQEFVKIR